MITDLPNQVTTTIDLPTEHSSLYTLLDLSCSGFHLAP